MSELNLLRLSQDFTLPLREAWKNKVHFNESSPDVLNTDSGHPLLKSIRRRWHRIVHTIVLSQKLWHGHREKSNVGGINNPIANRNNKYKMYLSFGIATILCHPFTYPIYSLLIRQLASPPSSEGIMKKLVRGIATLRRNRGILGMYRGGFTSLCSYFISLASDCIEHFFIQNYTQKNQTKWKMIISTAAFLISFVIRFPFDVVTTKIILNTDRQHSGTLSTFVKIWRQEGMSGLYSGWSASLMMALTNVLFASLISGRTSRGVEAFFNGIKLIFQFLFMITRITMNARSTAYRGSWDCFKHILRARGWRGLFSLMWVYFWIAPFCIPWLLASSSIYYYLVNESIRKKEVERSRKTHSDEDKRLVHSEPLQSPQQLRPRRTRSYSF